MYKPLTAGSSCEIILRLVTYYIFRSVGHVDDGPVCCTHHGFGLTVLIPVIGYDILLIILEVCHIRPKVNPP